MTIDLELKVAMLAHYVESIARVATVIPDDYLARLYGRSLFLGVDSFTKLAPELKNALIRTGKIARQDGEKISDSIKRLESDYEGYYAKIRDRATAHQQEVDLQELLEAWSEIDRSTLTILCEDTEKIWLELRGVIAPGTLIRPPEIDDRSFPGPIEYLAVDSQGGVQVGHDRTALMRPNTVSTLPTSALQERASRVLAPFDSFFRLINSGLEDTTSKWQLTEKAFLDLLVVDACSVIDNLFEDRPKTKNSPQEEALAELWKREGMRGATILLSFARNKPLEEKLRNLRNTFSAHIDRDEPLCGLWKKMVDFPFDQLVQYVNQIWKTLQQACAEDLRTSRFVHHGIEIKGITGVLSAFTEPFQK